MDPGFRDVWSSKHNNRVYEYTNLSTGILNMSQSVEIYEYNQEAVPTVMRNEIAEQLLSDNNMDWMLKFFKNHKVAGKIGVDACGISNQSFVYIKMSDSRFIFARALTQDDAHDNIIEFLLNRIVF
jgi:hypothetical protein